MRGSIGQILIQQGVIDASGLADALSRQSGRHPVASELYALGYASERELCTAIAAQTGWTAIVLDESAIRLDVLEHVSLEWARIFNALVVHEDETTLVIAAARPEDAIVPARELGHARGKQCELRIALDITLARTIRMAFRMWKLGELYLVGAECDPQQPKLSYVHPDGAEDEHSRAQRAIAEEASRSIEDQHQLPGDDFSVSSFSGQWNNSITLTSELEPPLDDRTQVIARELDRRTDPPTEVDLDESVDAPVPRTRALVVDPDAANRALMVAELERLDYDCRHAATGSQAVDLMQAVVFDLVFADIATPELDGLRMCRAIKSTRRMARTRVIVTTSVLDSGQIPDEVLQKHAVDGYLEKPLDVRRLHRLLRDLSTEERADHEVLLADALGRYHAGDMNGAIEQLRGAIAGDPASPKLHFMLANVLQRASRWAEAVDEYEAVVELQPAYFPALTRLAYLYFRQGLHARAVETWRRALPVCEDPALRRNIELFMRKLVADMQKSEAG